MSIAFDPKRLKNVTATEMATLFGLNKYDSPRTLVDRKLNPVVLTGRHLRRGVLREPSVVEAFNFDIGMKCRRHEDGTLVSDRARISATPDAFYLGANPGIDKEEIVECKSTMTRSFVKWMDEIPPHYHVQVLVQLYVTGLDSGYIGALEDGDPDICDYRFIVWKVVKNERIFELFEEEVARFWSLLDVENQTTKYRVRPYVKKEMVELMRGTSSLFYMTPEEVKEEEIANEEVPKETGVERLLRLFN